MCNGEHAKQNRQYGSAARGETVAWQALQCQGANSQMQNPTKQCRMPSAAFKDQQLAALQGLPRNTVPTRPRAAVLKLQGRLLECWDGYVPAQTQAPHIACWQIRFVGDGLYPRHSVTHLGVLVIDHMEIDVGVNLFSHQEHKQLGRCGMMLLTTLDLQPHIATAPASAPAPVQESAGEAHKRQAPM